MITASKGTDSISERKYYAYRSGMPKYGHITLLQNAGETKNDLFRIQGALYQKVMDDYDEDNKQQLPRVLLLFMYNLLFNLFNLYTWL